MTLEEIKQAVESGQTVHWANGAYQVIKGRNGRFLIQCTINGHCIGLTHADGQTINGKPEDFFIRSNN